MSTPASQSPGASGAAIHRPWADDPRADAKDALLAYVLERPAGVRISVAARDALDSKAGASDADYDLAHRFYREEYAHLFKTARRGWYWWVEPEPWAFHLKSSRQTSAEGVASGVDAGRVVGSLPSGAPGGRAAETARSVLRDRCSVTPGSRGVGVRAALRHALAAHRAGVDVEGMRADRVSAPARVAGRQAVFLGAFEAAARRHREGVVLTLTARPGESGDMVDTAVAVNESVDPLRDHLRRQTPGDTRPPAVVVREVTERGVLHLHVVVFGVGPGDIDREALSRYWHETRGHGYIVDVAPVERRPAGRGEGQRFRWVFGDHPTAPSERGRYVRSYLGEMLFRFREVAEASPGELHGGAVEGAWKVAVLWACGLPVVSVSASLRSVGVGRLRPRRGGGSPGRSARERVGGSRGEVSVPVVASRMPVGERGKPPPEPTVPVG